MTETPPPAEARVLSLTTRFSAAIALILATGGVVVTVAAWAYGQRAADEAYDRLLIGAASQIAASISLRPAGVVVDLPAPAFELLALAPRERILYRVLDQTGTTITGYEETPLPPDGAGVYDATVGGAAFRLAAVERRFAERAFSGTVRVLVGQTTEARTALARQLTESALAVLAAAGLVMAGLAVFAVRSALVPLRRIERGLAVRDPHDLTPLDLAVPREIASTVAAINRFMGRLEKQMATMRNLIADAAHQLRTPVAALRVQAEMAAEEDDPERQREIVRRIHRRSLGLGRLTDQLLSQALVAHRADAARHELLDLRSVAVAVAEASDHEAYGAAEDLRLDLPEDPVPVVGDTLSLVEACKNMINNAFRHGAPPVTLTVEHAGRTARIIVSDRGEGMPQALCEAAGTRFLRGSEGGGSPAGAGTPSGGLGLAIVRAVAETHRGALRFSREGGTFAAALELPAGAP